MEAEVLDFRVGSRTENGRQHFARHGYVPARKIMTDIGPVTVRRSSVRDREAAADCRIRFMPVILPPFMRRSKVLPMEISPKRSPVTGQKRTGLSPPGIVRLKEGCLDECAALA